MLDISANDRFAKHCGIELLEFDEGYAKARLVLAEEHLNGLDRAHGAAVFALADLAFAVAANSYGPPAMAINVHISYFKGASAGTTLTAEATPISVSRRLGTFSVTVTDEEGDTVAIFQGMAYRRTETSITSQGRQTT